MLDINLSSQGYTFLCSLLNGLVLAFIYTIFKCIRLAFSNRKIPTIICDVLYMLLFTLFTYIFSIGFTQGRVRYYVLIGEVLAILIYKFTLGWLLDKLFARILKLFRKIYMFLQKNISVFAKKLLKACHKMLYNIVNKKTNRKGSV
ncbi:MAG: spore cortex biosynthesis protein YabQ [Clostridia bacterium]|nr:spore cortex biosynthesis protein YabQ [Clostridia bacterium]